MSGLYRRDYRSLSSVEQQELADLRANFGQLKFVVATRPSKPVAHYQSLFPNHYLDPSDLQADEDVLRNKVNDFSQLLDQTTTGEREILNYIRDQELYFVVGSILKRGFRFGHHATYLFPELRLGTSFQVDYLIIGLGSGGHELVFVEFECPSAKAVLQDGRLGNPFRKGIAQTEDWQLWLEVNFQTLVAEFDKCLSPESDLPSDLRQLDTSRLHYVVVAGRRAHFKNKTRQIERRSNTMLLHYDNLVDNAFLVIGDNY